MTDNEWQQKVQVKQAEGAAKVPAEWRLSPETLAQLAPDANVLQIPRTCGILSDREILITETADAIALLEKLATREFSATEVATAFCKRAAIAQQLTFCLTETFFDQALERARQLDDHFATTGRPVGPLHGLPISLKESFNVAGIPSSLGFVSFLNRPAPTANSALVDILLGAGAILYVKTNIPQTMMTADSHNNVFGRVLNPNRRNLTAGGSTGGEGALLALRGSILGAGTDVAGSIRIPALCCGITGFKPTSGRVPYGGQTGAGRPGLVGIASVAGPLCRSIRDAELFLQLVTTSDPDDLDDGALHVPWRKIEPTSGSLTIGLLPEDPSRPLHPPMLRTMAAAVKKLKAAGHRIVDLAGKTPLLSAANDLTFRYFTMDPDRTQLVNIRDGGEPQIPSLRISYDPSVLIHEPTLRELYDMNVTRAEAAANIRRVFLNNGLDLILAPAFQSCAVPHDEYDSAVYTTMPNLFDYPACVIPFGQANEEADAASVRDVEYIPRYKPKEVEGAPCHVQLIGRRLRDEVLVQHAKVVESVLKDI